VEIESAGYTLSLEKFQVVCVNIIVIN